MDVASARTYLIGVARRANEGRLPSYGDVAATYGGIARAAGPVLNSVARECEQRGEPDLSALVVDKRTGLPGTYAGRPVTVGSQHEVAWRSELARIRRHAWES